MSNITMADMASRSRRMEKKAKKKKWIQGADIKEGAFTAKAKRAGKGVQEYAREKKDAPGRLGKQARLALAFNKMSKDRKSNPLHDHPRSARKD